MKLSGGVLRAEGGDALKESGQACCMIVSLSMLGSVTKLLMQAVR